MKNLVLAFALCGHALAAGETFEERLERAKQVEESTYGKDYIHAMWKAVDAQTSAAMHDCFRKGTTPDTSAFVLVANVLADRTLSGVEARPPTPMTQCFVERFVHADFPQPPEIFGDTGIPIVLEVSIHP
jgi:hypothetical protein